MTLSYSDRMLRKMFHSQNDKSLEGNTRTTKVKTTKVKAEITTEHSTRPYGQPVIVTENGDAIDLLHWIYMDYKIEELSSEERTLLGKMIFDSIPPA